MRKFSGALLLVAAMLMVGASQARAACCYFAALGKDINQPGQKAFIVWDQANDLESFTVQPAFQGNATDFGMVIPTPSRPKLQEMPRDFFKALAIFTILEPMDLKKYKRMMVYKSSRGGAVEESDSSSHVRVLESGVVGSLEYKILEADRADALFDWLKQNRYNYGGDTATLNYYVRKQWTFTVMKIDPRQMKKAGDGSYTGDVTPTRLQFVSKKLIYPLHITQLSVKDATDALFYVMAKEKTDMPDEWSYEPNFLTMWSQALGYAVPEKITREERQWQAVVQKIQPRQATQGGTLEWAGRLTSQQMAFITGDRPYDRDAPPQEVKSLQVLRGHLQRDWYLTKFRKSFEKGEMTHDLELVPARIGGAVDDIEYTSILPTSPP